LERQKVAYYFYKDNCYEEKPKGFFVAQYVTDSKTGDCYAVLKKKGVPVYVWLIFLCSIALRFFVGRMPVEEWVLQVTVPTELSSFVCDRVYVGMCVQGMPEMSLQLKLYGEDGRCLLQGYPFRVGQVVGNVVLQEDLYFGAEVCRLELWREEPHELIFEKAITIVYRGEEVP